MTTQHREPIGFANYRGKTTVDFYRPMGPNYMGELMWPVTAVYLPDRDVTRVGFSLIAPDEVTQ